jgi:hypothetical protein
MDIYLTLRLPSYQRHTISNFSNAQPIFIIFVIFMKEFQFFFNIIFIQLFHMWQIHTDETKSSLQFASRALRVTNCAKVNEVSPKLFPSSEELFYFDLVLFIFVSYGILLYFSVCCVSYYMWSFSFFHFLY